MDPRAAHNDSNPKIYLDIQIGEVDAGRMTIEVSIPCELYKLSQGTHLILTEWIKLWVCRSCIILH